MPSKRYPALAAAVFHEPWVILPSKFEALIAVLELRLSGETVSGEQVRAITAGAASLPKIEAGSKIAVLPLFGVLTQHAGMVQESSGGTSTEQFSAQFNRAVEDPGIGAVVLAVNSPGGSVYGTQELADQVFAARGVKPVIAAINSEAASGAYWIASQAQQVIITPGGNVGSIGVISAHQDISQAEAQAGLKTTLLAIPDKKAQFSPYAPLADEAAAELRQKNAAIYERFVAAVARGRGVKPAEVKAGYGGGGMLAAREALAAGMVDRIAPFAQVIAELVKHAAPKQANSARALALLRLAEAE